MHSSFYEHLQVAPDASSARIRDAYAGAAARLDNRRKELDENGGDTSAIDDQRSSLDEAWDILSDPMRRRRYDAYLAFNETRPGTSVDALWEQARPYLVHPAAASAIKLLRVTTQLTAVEAMPLAASGASADPPTLIPHDDDRTQPRITRLRPSPPKLAPPPAPLPAAAGNARPAATNPQAQQVQASVAADLQQMQQAPKIAPPPPPSDPGVQKHAMQHLIDTHGCSGALLRAARTARRLSLREVATRTRISERYLEALELESFDSLPSAPFVRGYVGEVARLLELDGDEVITGYMNRYTAG